MRRLHLGPRGWLVAALAILLALNGVWQLSRVRCWQLVGEVTCRVETERQIVALTFDDGPTPIGVTTVLPLLEQYDATATFFLVGREIERHPGLAERLLAAGHELGNHTWSHERNVGHLPAYYRSEVSRTDAALRAAGAQPVLFRPPFGKRLVGLPLAVEDAGYRMVTWDVADNPIRFSEPRAYADDILSQVRPGSIILIHPMYRNNQVGRDALPLVMAGLAQRGYQMVSVSQLLELEGK